MSIYVPVLNSWMCLCHILITISKKNRILSYKYQSEHTNIKDCFSFGDQRNRMADPVKTKKWW